MHFESSELKSLPAQGNVLHFNVITVEPFPHKDGSTSVSGEPLTHVRFRETIPPPHGTGQAPNSLVNFQS